MQLSPKRALLGPCFLLWGKVRAWEWMPRFPSCMGCCQKGSFVPCPVQSTESWTAWLEGNEQLGELQPGLKTDGDPTSHITDSIGRPAYKPLGKLHLWISLTVPLAPPVLHMPHPHTHTPPTTWPAPCVSSRDWREICRRLVGTYNKLAQTCRPWRDHTLEHLALPLGNQRETVSTQPGLAGSEGI